MWRPEVSLWVIKPLCGTWGCWMEMWREKRKKHLLMELAQPPIIASELRQTVIIHAVEGKRGREWVGGRKSSKGERERPPLLPSVFASGSPWGLQVGLWRSLQLPTIRGGCLALGVSLGPHTQCAQKCWLLWTMLEDAQADHRDPATDVSVSAPPILLPMAGSWNEPPLDQQNFAL